MKNSKRGSEWRRWDLHIHTPGTKLSDGFGNAPETWKRYIDFLENSPVQVFGITDYFCADGYFNLIDKYQQQFPESNKVFFLNIEFRIAEVISGKNDNPHIHVLFDNDLEIISRDKIDKFLHKLETAAKNDSGVRIACKDLKTKSDFESASIGIQDLENALKSTFGNEKPYLIAFPAKNNGIKSTDSNSPRKVLISERLDKAADLFFGDEKSRKYFLETTRYKEGESKSKPVVSGSDSHSFDDLDRLNGDVASHPPTWIKADTTFRGLKQICYEPESRVFIGSEPHVEERKIYQATKFISEIAIQQVDGYDESNGIWFKNIEIPINPELTVIIGNKGSGKSAIVDIIGLLGNSRQEEYFSFLSNKANNKKFKQRGFAENFQSTIKWRSSNTESKILDESVDLTKPEAVRYLPQNYFEKLTNALEIEEFRKEIEDVVFSHVDKTKRMGKTNFSDLQNFQTDQISQEIKSLRSELSEINLQIIELEERSDPIHQKTLEEKLLAKRIELRSLIDARPQEVQKPEEESETQKNLTEALDSLNKKKESIKNSIQDRSDLLSNKRTRLGELSLLLDKVRAFKNKIKTERDEIELICGKLNIDVDSIITADINTSPVQENIDCVKQEVSKLEESNILKFDKETDFTNISSLPDLRDALSYIEEEIKLLKEQLGAPQRKYQKYLDKLQEWHKNILSIEGEPNNPQPETIKYLETEIQYINNDLSNKLESALTSRKELSKKIFNTNERILLFYKDIKQNVEKSLAKVQDENFLINIDASFVLENSFSRDFLKHISKNKKGPFHGTNEPDKVLKLLLSDVNFNDYDSIHKFIENILCMMRGEHNTEILYIKNQVMNKSEFYDFLFSLSYISAKYELRSGGKNLNELSPGEKGLLLLIFYLHLDKDNIPLVIDQPEDNLDNDSIFKVLSKCIREAKNNRQVILVTHNPNLAVCADAEQVIYVKLNKSKNNKFSFESGSIENPAINDKILLILEGSQPAFVQRRLKYQI